VGEVMVHDQARRAREPLHQHPLVGIEDPGGQRAAKVFDSVPNTLILCVVSDGSLHAVRAMPPHAVRDSLQYFLQVD
jgi:hypothetical protein